MNAVPYQGTDPLVQQAIALAVVCYAIGILLLILLITWWNS